MLVNQNKLDRLPFGQTDGLSENWVPHPWSTLVRKLDLQKIISLKICKSTPTKPPAGEAAINSCIGPRPSSPGSGLAFSLGKVPAIGLGCPAQPWLPLLCSFSSSSPPPTVLELSRCLLPHCMRGETIHRRPLEMCLGFLQHPSPILATSLSLLMTS